PNVWICQFLRVALRSFACEILDNSVMQELRWQRGRPNQLADLSTARDGSSCSVDSPNAFFVDLNVQHARLPGACSFLSPIRESTPDRCNKSPEQRGQPTPDPPDRLIKPCPD